MTKDTHPEHVLGDEGCSCYHDGWERGYSDGFKAGVEETRVEYGEPAIDAPDPDLPVN